MTKQDACLRDHPWTTRLECSFPMQDPLATSGTASWKSESVRITQRATGQFSQNWPWIRCVARPDQDVISNSWPHHLVASLTNCCQASTLTIHKLPTSNDDAVQTVMCPAINVVFLSWVHFLMHGGIMSSLLPFISASLPALLLANWKVL
jgi:hypothetical protein